MTTLKYSRLDLDAFVRAVAVNRDTPHALLLGAGASITSGVPSAGACTWDWKRQIFLTKNPGLESQFREFSLPSVQQKVQRWLDDQSMYPSPNSDEEYGFYVEQCYPLEDDRRQYFQNLAQRAEPYTGYRILALLGETGLVSSTWTTNFDRLVSKAIDATTAKVTPIEVGLDSAIRAARVARRGELLCVAMHGDYRYDALKNTSSELQNQDQQFRSVLCQRLTNETLIVVGYSGRDKSVMQALEMAYSQPGKGRLYWCGHGEGEPASSVSRLLELAVKNGRTAVYVATQGFDDTMFRLGLECTSGDIRNRIQKMHLGSVSNQKLAPFKIEIGKTVGIIKSNAFPVECPTEILQFEAVGFDGLGKWKQIEEKCDNRELVAAPLRNKILAIGVVSDVRDAFGEAVKSEIERVPLTEEELKNPNSVITSLLTRALVRGLARKHDLETNGKSLVSRKNSNGSRRIYSNDIFYHDSAWLSLKRYGGKHYLVIDPSVKGLTQKGDNVSLESEKELKRLILTKQYNKEYNAALKMWSDLLLSGTEDVKLEFPSNNASSFRFLIRRNPTIARINRLSGSDLILPSNIQKYVGHKGIQLDEPFLVFSDKSGHQIQKDTHALRSILEHQPYDYSLNNRGFGNNVQIGVICPSKSSNLLANYLNGMHNSYKVGSNEGYILDFPEFSNAFGVLLSIPQPNQSGWSNCIEPNTNISSELGALELARNICTSIDLLQLASSPSVIVIFIPKRWESWKRYDVNGKKFDLHDFVKAYCVTKGICTQFFREETLESAQDTRIRWWLALSFYVKSRRTPWILDSLDRDTAFLGLGFKFDRNASRGRQIILGCSHIYSSDGLGLRYQLSKLQDSVIRNRNPFMSRKDARRTGESVRQLFYESTGGRLPSRVVIHKRTPFDEQEQEGLLEGLAGIQTVDMLEINFEDAMKFVSIKSRPDGIFEPDGFPVKRGTAVVLDPKRALLWVHGSAPAAANPHRTYYLGGNRIPAPLVIIRHHGDTAFPTLAREILGLSKMNWNSFDLHTKLPATIESSNEIAKIGALLERFGPLSYDYRLFI